MLEKGESILFMLKVIVCKASRHVMKPHQINRHILNWFNMSVYKSLLRD